MWRALVFLGLLCLAAYGAVWLANHPETVAVTWAGREYSTSLAVGVVALVAAVILVSVVLGAIRLVVRLPALLARRSRQNAERRGHRAISRGIVAVASGDLAAGRRYAADAERLVGHQPLALLLKAQSAQASGDREAAETAFRDMTHQPDTRALGLRGLYVEARRRGDVDAARDHAEEAARLAPALTWANDAVLEAHSADGDWRGAIQIVERRTSLGLVDRATSRRQRAVLLAADAAAREPSDPDGALAAAQEAVKLAPSLVPAAALAARLLSRRGDLKRAARIIEAAWSEMPHPELAAAYLNLRAGDSAIDRLRRAETLARLSSWSDESRLAIARTAIDARELPRAREVLRPVLEEEQRPTVRVCMMMAELENRAGNAGAVREWLARAARAPRDKAWMADGIVSEHWAPVSPTTGRLDAFTWETPPEVLGAPTEHEMAGFAEALESAREPDEIPLIPDFLGAAPLNEPVGAVRPDAEPPARVDDPPNVPAADAVADRVQPIPAAILPEEATQQAGSVEQTRDSLPEFLRRGAAAGDPPARTDAPGAEAAAVVAEPVATQPPRQADANGSARRVRPSPDPEPVVFPVPRAPDDPGLESETDRRQRFRLRV